MESDSRTDSDVYARGDDWSSEDCDSDDGSYGFRERRGSLN